MSLILGFLITSFIINSILLIPFINFLYQHKLQRARQKTKDALDVPTPLFDSFHKYKAGTPIGGGLLLIATTVFLTLVSLPIFYYFWIPITSIYKNITSEIKILLFTFLSFGLIGFYDDIKKIFFGNVENFFGMRLRHKLILEVILSTVSSYWLYSELKIQIVHIPFVGVVDLGVFYIPFAVFVIVAFANAFNITDGLDGLAMGLLMIALTSFWVISYSILDTPISLFIGVWLGGVIAFLYFNIYPARIFLGDVGALSFGATLAIIGLMLGKVFSLLVVGGIFVAEVFSSLMQLLSKKYLNRKAMKAAPLHLWFQTRGWHESTIVFRAWIAGIVLALFGLWLAFLK